MISLWEKSVTFSFFTVKELHKSSIFVFYITFLCNDRNSVKTCDSYLKKDKKDKEKETLILALPKKKIHRLKFHCERTSF